METIANWRGVTRPLLQGFGLIRAGLGGLPRRGEERAEKMGAGMKIAPLLGHDVSVCIDPLADLSSTPNWIWCRLRMEVVVVAGGL